MTPEERNAVDEISRLNIEITILGKTIGYLQDLVRKIRSELQYNVEEEDNIVQAIVFRDKTEELIYQCHEAAKL